MDYCDTMGILDKVRKRYSTISGGGCYDDLVGMFDSKGKRSLTVSLVLDSVLGYERIFSISEAKAKVVSCQNDVVQLASDWSVLLNC
uniref:Class II Histidinyl-tRNA synthetase (HisRS)-like catalytic core domain-containing protein n=1 Tax=Amphimedon queenslandica TaxID=400682 RepID=A0A1X7UH49_AMPQE